MKLIVMLAVAGWCCGQAVCGQPIGNWAMSDKALPVYHYTGPLPFTAVDPNGKDANQPYKPYISWLLNCPLIK